MHRDRFYDRELKHVDWQGVRAKYAPLVDRLGDRADLDDLLGQMIGELGTLHSQVQGADLRKASDTATTAFLGATFEREPIGFRISRIYRTEPELPGERGPLAAPGVDVREGDLVLAVNGHAATQVDDLSELLQNRAGQQVLISLRRGEKTVRAVVTPVNAERNAELRYSDWEDSRRRQVDALGAGRIGYLHLRAMGPHDIATFAREFYANTEREGLIIDVRRNDGGNIDSWVIEKLLRRAWAFWVPRNGPVPHFNMQHTFRGRLAVLIDERTYSDGETFAAGIQALKLAPLVGRRTAGAGVWLSDENILIDRGIARVAEEAQFDAATGVQLVENRGVAPDIDVENLPHASFMGSDLQLETAVRTVLDMLKPAH
jgi:tricorn protease